MAKRRIGSAPKKSVAPPQKTTLGNFFGKFWGMLAQEKREEEEVRAVEELAFKQISQKQQKTQLRLKR